MKREVRSRWLVSLCGAAPVAFLFLAPAMAHPRVAPEPLHEPLPWEDAGPLAAPFLQLPFESPATLASGQLQAEVRTIYANSIASAQSADLEVAYHLETDLPSAVVRYGLADGLELHLEAAAVLDEIAFLDPAIKSVESWFGSENKLRRIPLSREPYFLVARPGGPAVSFASRGARLGDMWLGAKGLLLRQDGAAPALALRVALKLPLGQFPDGSGVVEEGLGLLAAYDLRRLHVWAAADLMVPDGPVSPLRLETRPHPAFQLAVGRELGSKVLLLLQGSAHGSALRPVHVGEADGWTFYLVGGARVMPAESLSFGLGVIENLFAAERGIDIGAILDLTWRPR